MAKNEIEMIAVERIRPHPDNPRKDLGDLSELSASIKEKGIYQNLTVVPGSFGYTCIIGHRRLAAAKLAGLTEVPCIVRSMTEKEQLSCMLLENMQRSDLTLVEQAGGIQMMLDLGDSVSDISKSTGLSESTVRRRSNLMKIATVDKLKKAEQKGATLADYEKLLKIEDPVERDRCLMCIGTSNFDWEIKKAVEKEERQKNYEKVREKIKSFATEVENRKGLYYVRFISACDDFTVPEDADTVNYYYVECNNGRYFELFRDKNEAELAQESAREEERIAKDRLKAELSAIAKQAYDLRREFVRTVYIDEKQYDTLMKFAVASIIKNQNNYKIITDDEFCFVAGIEEGDTSETLSDIIVSMPPKKVLLLAAYCNFHDSENWSYADYNCKYTKNDRLDIIYSFLEDLGYQCSDEEKAWREGTHKLYAENPGA
ncbi:MAG: ParB/RepB/Spo0J family partition protein [Clostridia bacterium]